MDYRQWVEIQSDILRGNEFDKNVLLNYLKLNCAILLKGTKFYRARLISEEDKNELNQYRDVRFYGFSSSGCGAPPPEKVDKDGRCNRVGQSVLYLAEDQYTALAETRPGKRKRVSIAEFNLKRDVKIIDIIYNESDDSNSAIKQIALNFYIVQNENADYYRITQCISRIVKEAGFDGIRYSSSLSETGRNVVLFDVAVAECINSKVYQIFSLLYYAEEQLPRNNDEKLLPTSITNRFSDENINWFFNQIKKKDDRNESK